MTTPYDTGDYLQKLAESHPLREPLLRRAIGELQLPVGSRGLDAGCGLGHQSLLLAEAVGPDGHITGLDLEPEFVQYARTLAKEAGLEDRVSFRDGDLNALPFEDNTFDWVWSVDCVGYPIGDLTTLLQGLSRVTRPGGTIAILAWSSQTVLPGYQLLEARLNATCSSFEPYLDENRPRTHFLRALHSFHQAGLTETRVRTFVEDVQAPLDAEFRGAMISLFDMLWGQPRPGVAPVDRAAFERLCRPDSPECILDLPDYCAFFTYTMFRGRVPDFFP